jgi:hypothetical protein
MRSSHSSHQGDGRWAWKAAGLVAAGGFALLGGLIASIFEQAPNYVPLAGATVLVLCYGAAGIVVFRNA